jgi:Flp pilus assembly protein TadG
MRTASRRRPHGQELLEFALILPVLVLLLFGIIDMGRVVYYYSALQNAVREGARYGIVDPARTANIDGVVRSKAIGLIPAELTQVAITNDNANHTLAVRYRYRFVPVTPLIGAFFPGGQATITASTTMYHEY